MRLRLRFRLWYKCVRVCARSSDGSNAQLRAISDWLPWALAVGGGSIGTMATVLTVYGIFFPGPVVSPMCQGY